MFRYVATLLYAYSAVVLGAAADLSKVNGSIDAGQGQRAGDVSTVNGSITIGPVLPSHPGSRKPTCSPG